MGKGGNLVRKVFHLVAGSLFLAALVVMFKTFPAVKDGPTITGASQQLPRGEGGAAAAANKAIAADAGAVAVTKALEGGGSTEGGSAEQAKAATVSAAEKKALDDDPKVKPHAICRCM